MAARGRGSMKMPRKTFAYIYLQDINRNQCFVFDQTCSFTPNSWMNRADNMAPSGGAGKGTGKRLAAQRLEKPIACSSCSRI